MDSGTLEEAWWNRIFTPCQQILYLRIAMKGIEKGTFSIKGKPQLIQEHYDMPSG